MEISCAFFLLHTRCLGLSRHPGCLQGTKIAHEPTVTNTLKLIHFQVLSFTAISLAVAGPGVELLDNKSLVVKSVAALFQ